ncbi:MAG: beta-glucanase precursor [Verrucomicrobiota bacterium]
MNMIRFALVLACVAPAAVVVPVLHGQEQPVVSYDFGDNGSATLTGKAWQAYEAGNLAAVEAYTGRCIELYKQAALTQQSSLTEPVPTSNPEAVHAHWALNDVGTSYFILGQALEKAGKQAEAIKAYREVADKLAFAKCWDTKGWFWSPADAAKGRIKALEFDAAMM